MTLQERYNEFARRFSFKYPFLSFVGIHFNFWIFANLLLGVILYLYFLVISEVFLLPPVHGSPVPILLALLFGIVQGVSLGICEFFLDKRFFRNQSFGKAVLLKAGINFIILLIFTYVLIYFILPSAFKSFFKPVLVKENYRLWHLLFSMLAFYYFFMSLLISYINQVNKKFGPGILVPLLLGSYRKPHEEERIFMFMDLNASTTIAEKLGHLTYSSFIQDCFLDINVVVPLYNAEIYQYVGDEIVLTWRLNQRIKNHLPCLDLFFACEKRFGNRFDYYIKKYGQVPSFKAGVHMGKVTAVEIGDVKREIAYHGDTLNTAARVLSLCNEYKKKLLATDTVILDYHENKYVITSIGAFKLKGKIQEVGIVSVEPVQ